MTTPQLVSTALALALAAAACTRGETDQEARDAAADVRQAAELAGDRLADGWITTKIQAQYFADDDIKARYINVATRDGVVTISGYVESPEIREQALQIARNTDGVKQVVADRLLIGAPATAFEPGSTAQEVVSTAGRAAEDAATVIEDARVTTMIQAKYFLDTLVKGRNIDVDTRGGVVTLRGEVASERERAQALLLARTTPGVRRVEDHLTVNPSLPAPPASAPASGAAGTTGAGATAERPEDAALADAVSSRLAGDAQARRATIEVTARDGVVLLQGTAPTEAAKQRALSVARETAGVVQVVDRVTVSRARR